MEGALVPDDLHATMALETGACATQRKGLDVVEVNRKQATQDMHMFGATLTWPKSIHVWGTAGVVTVGKDSKTYNRGTTLMFVGYEECEIDNIRMWDPYTISVAVACNIIWLRHMHVQQEDIVGVLEIEDKLETIDVSVMLIADVMLSSWEATLGGAAVL